MRVKLFVVTAVLMIAGIAEAGLSKTAQEWRRGPEKFLITDEEGKTWKALTSDADAAAFIDLFWARRDPTSGTPRNEFREEFLSRVRFAEGSFKEKRTRGSLSERGQVYILLGPPEAGTSEAMTMKGHEGMSGASARHAENVVWTWPREVAVSLGVPKLSATFNQVVGTDMFTRDTKFGQFSNVSATAIRKNIVHPEMTAAPEWALRVSNEVFSGGVAPPPPGNAKAEGQIGRLVLMSDFNTLNLDADTDPLALQQPMTEFAMEGDLAYVLEYCGSQGSLKIETRINNLSAASELQPVPMKAVKGCGAIPGTFSLSGFKPGSYELEITTIEPNGARQTAKQGFQIK